MEKDKKSRIGLAVIPAVLIFTCAGISLFNTIKQDGKIEANIEKEYDSLLINDSINSVVLSTYYPAGWRGGQYNQNVKLEDGKSYTIRISDNITSQDILFGDLVKPGVVLKKSIGSDTLTVINGDEVFQYLIFGQ